MNKRLEYRNGITLIGLVVTIIILLIIVGIAISALGGENGLISKTKLAKKKYEIGEAKEKIEFAIADLRIEYEGKGENLTKEALPKINSDEIDVGSVENFPVDVICEKYKFNVDENFVVTYVGEANGTIITYTTEPEGYTNQDEINILIKISNQNGIKVIGETQDAEPDEVSTKSGIDHYEYYLIHSSEATVKYDNSEIEITAGGTYKLYAIAYDRAGNTKTSNTINIQIIKPAQVSAGLHTLEIDSEGNLWAWGRNRCGQLGNETTTNSTSPVQIKSGTKFNQITTGYYHSLAIDESGNLWVWGRNDYGQLGNGTTTNSTIPVQI